MTQTTVDPKATQKIHIGNLAASATEADVRALFSAHGEVASYERPMDNETNQPSGWAFVEMARADAAKAIEAVNGQLLSDQALAVSEARPRS